MKNQFIPYELALSLKGLGFNDNCLAFYTSLDTLDPVDTDFVNFRKVDDEYIKAPLWQQAFDWFESKQSLYCEIQYDFMTYDIVIHGYPRGGEPFQEKLISTLSGATPYCFTGIYEARLGAIKRMIELAKPLKNESTK